MLSLLCGLFHKNYVKMYRLVQFATFIVLAGTVCAQTNNSTFPDDFSFGAVTAAFQVEGAWDEDSKGESIWDYFVHSNPSRIINKDNADVACDSYHKYKEDVAMAANLGLTHYRFSISWSRILPTGFTNDLSMKGILYYQNLIRELEKYNITPVVTMYYYDLPQSIQDVGGWTNPDIVDYFTAYAEILFEHFASVKHWITINEPKQVCVGGYGKGTYAPGNKASGVADYVCAYNVIKAHAAAYRLYQNKFSHTEAKISMSLDCTWNIPKSNSTADTEAAERKLLFEFGLYAHPLIFGDWPDVVKKRVENRSKIEGFHFSRLPSFSEEEQSTINNTLDYLSLNFYTTKLVEDTDEASNSSFSLDNDMRIIASVDPSWPASIDGKSIYPDGLRSILKWLKNTYNKTIFIAENGIGDDGSTLNDFQRLNYLQNYLGAVLDSMHVDNVDITGYTILGLMDSFEWAKGYSLHYGLYSVNFNDANKTRTPKMSADYYSQIIKARKIVDPSNIPTLPPIPTLPTTSEDPTTAQPTGSTENPVTPSSAQAHSFTSFLVVIAVVTSVIFMH